MTMFTHEWASWMNLLNDLKLKRIIYFKRQKRNFKNLWFYWRGISHSKAGMNHCSFKSVSLTDAWFPSDQSRPFIINMIVKIRTQKLKELSKTNRNTTTQTNINARYRVCWDVRNLNQHKTDPKNAAKPKSRISSATSNMKHTGYT